MDEDYFEDLLPDLKECTLSDICRLPIRRSGEVAEIITAYYQGNRDKPVRMVGFSTESWKKDFEIYEEGWDYLQRLNDECRNIKDKE